MDTAALRALEEAAFAAWPSRETTRIGEWVLRTSGGYTKRANSINVLGDPGIPMADASRQAEAHLAAAGLPPVYRITSFADAGALDQSMAERGFSHADPTRVMTIVPERFRMEAGSGGTVVPLAGWFPAWCALSGIDPASHTEHLAILERIGPGIRPTLLLDLDNQPASAGLGVLEGDRFGLFDIVTDPAKRGHGHGERLVRGMLGNAAAEGAGVAFLQVMERNEAARRLYGRIGFTDAYHYWYRLPPA